MFQVIGHKADLIGAGTETVLLFGFVTALFELQNICFSLYIPMSYAF
jgi:hypothetical protein